MEWREELEKTEPSAWEQSFRTAVQQGEVAIDDWLWHWLWKRIDWPERQHSLFKAGNVLLDAVIFEVRVLVEVGHQSKFRYIHVRLFEGNPYHPDFEEWLEVSKQERRFPSFGNPFLDEENYEFWEKMLFCKLFNQALEEKKGLDFLIERSRRT
ncbi:MAG: hypothetical protein ACRBFS_10470 [Aureispira sp.]